MHFLNCFFDKIRRMLTIKINVSMVPFFLGKQKSFSRIINKPSSNTIFVPHVKVNDFIPQYFALTYAKTRELPGDHR